VYSIILVYVRNRKKRTLKTERRRIETTAAGNKEQALRKNVW
jgi:hypothetical protein